ncbi:hypothetical protein J6590_004475 [Homalodisca vitripennis]|nr:hypothetical protein J6590_004475 [Homalodisca vitripennis]
MFETDQRRSPSITSCSACASPSELHPVSDKSRCRIRVQFLTQLEDDLAVRGEGALGSCDLERRQMRSRGL